MTKIQEAREKAITAFAEYIKQDQHGTQKSNHIREMIFVNAQLIAEHLLDLPEARAYYEALLENEGYVKRIQGIADRAGVQVMMSCNYCGHTGVDVHENTQRTYAGTLKTIGVCDNIRQCSENMVRAIQEKAINTAELC